jgi:Na+/H+ antiporter NhaD/arsenite permease-like protein
MNGREPLWLPRGSIRALMGLLLVLAFVVVVLRSSIVIEAKDLNTIVTLVVGFYFIAKAAAQRNGGDS